jgi:hypothetical protein
MGLDPSQRVFFLSEAVNCLETQAIFLNIWALPEANSTCFLLAISMAFTQQLGVLQSGIAMIQWHLENIIDTSPS